MAPHTMELVLRVRESDLLTPHARLLLAAFPEFESGESNVGDGAPEEPDRGTQLSIDLWARRGVSSCPTPRLPL